MRGIWTKAELAARIDHTLLKATATESAVKLHCREAKDNRFASVCVNPYWVPLCSRELAGTGVLVCAVVGYPLGASSTRIKVAETRKAVEDGASEIDMVINIGEAKAGNWKAVEDEIRQVVEAAGKAQVRANIETCYLSRDEKKKASRAAAAAGAAYIKTSTGFGTGGATVEDVALIKAAVGDGVGVKASGGIRTMADAVAMLEAGADRIGSSSGLAIVSEAVD